MGLKDGYFLVRDSVTRKYEGKVYRKESLERGVLPQQGWPFIRDYTVKLFHVSGHIRFYYKHIDAHGNRHKNSAVLLAGIQLRMFTTFSLVVSRRMGAAMLFFS